MSNFLDLVRYLLGRITREELTYRRIQRQSKEQWLSAYKKASGE